MSRSVHVRSVPRLPSRLSAAVLAALFGLLLVGARVARASGYITTTSESVLKSAVNGGGLTILNFGSPQTITLSSALSPGPNTILTATNAVVTLTGNGVTRLLKVPAGVSCMVSNIIFVSGANAGSNGFVGATGNAGDPGVGGGNGAFGFGGAVLNAGSLVLSGCQVTSSTAIGGNGGAGGDGGTGTFGENGGNGGGGGLAFGAGICNQGTLLLTNTTVSGNTVVGGNGGPGGTNSPGSSVAPGNGGMGANGYGSGLYNSNGAVAVIINSTITGNTAVGGGSQAAGQVGGSGNGITGPNGGSGQGAGVYNVGTLTVINSTFFQNTASGGNGGNGSAGHTFNGGNGGNGGSSYGANLCNGGTLGVTNCTFSSGATFGGTNGAGGSGPFASGSNGSMGQGLGDNLANLAGTFDLMNSILDTPLTSSNAVGAITDDGYNISSDFTPSTLTGTGSTLDVDPNLDTVLDTNNSVLAPLPTLTIALLYPSPAMTAAGPAPYPFDQRGFPRAKGLVDIGAFQYTGVSVFSIAGFVFVDTNVLVGTNIVNNTIPGIAVTASGLVNGVTTTATDTNGGYNFNALLADTYTVSPQPPGLFSPSSATFTVGPSNPNAGANFIATPAGSALIHGKADLTNFANTTSNRSFLLTFLVLSNRTYRVQEATNVMTNNTPWVTVATSNSPNGILAYTFTNSTTNAPPRFFFRTATP